MYLIELKDGDLVIRKYIPDNNALERLIETELPRYEYIKILEEIKDRLFIETKGKKR